VFAPLFGRDDWRDHVNHAFAIAFLFPVADDNHEFLIGVELPNGIAEINGSAVFGEFNGNGNSTVLFVRFLGDIPMLRVILDAISIEKGVLHPSFPLIAMPLHFLRAQRRNQQQQKQKNSQHIITPLLAAKPSAAQKQRENDANL
jgi:hypothetical protein